MKEEWISLNEFMRRRNVGYEVALQMLANGEVEYQKIGNRYKIKVGGDTVSRKEYEEIKRERDEYKTTINILKSILVKENT